MDNFNEINEPPEWLINKDCYEHYKELVKVNNKVDLLETKIDNVMYIEIGDNGGKVKTKTNDLIKSIHDSLEIQRDIIKLWRLLKKYKWVWVTVIILVMFLFNNEVAIEFIKQVLK